jgi:hypothetical protein
MNTSPVPTVILMAKAPRPGTVKTRLALDVGAERACAIYRWMVERQLSEIPSGWRVEVFFDPPGSLHEMQFWLGERDAFHPQSTGDLGARMCTAAESAFSRSPSAVILVGGDCPELSTRDLEKAYSSLQSEADVVFGPASDGGYYLLGLRAMNRGLFEGISWSSSSTLEESLAKAATLQLNVSILGEKEDIDTVDSFERAVAGGLIPRGLGIPGV